MTVTGDLEEHFRNQIQQVDGDFHLGVSPQVAEGLLNQLEQSMAQMSAMGHMPVLLVAPSYGDLCETSLVGFFRSSL